MGKHNTYSSKSEVQVETPGEKNKKDIAEYYCDLYERWGPVLPKNFPIDDIDLRILCELRENSRMPNTVIAEKLQISEATVRRRVNNLVENGIIENFSICVNFDVIEKNVKAYIGLDILPERVEEISEKLRKCNYVIALYKVLGERNLICVVATRTLDELQQIVDKIGHLKAIKDISVNIVMHAYRGKLWTSI